LRCLSQELDGPDPGGINFLCNQESQIMPRNRHAAIAVVLAAALAAVLLAGCGSSSSEPLTKAEFVKQGNEICEGAAKQRQEDLKAATDESGEQEGLSDYVDIALESVKEMTSELSDLEPPAAQKKEAEKLVKDLESEVEALEASPEEPVTATSFKDANATAERNGLSACTI
jgi:uncharacterized membrane protein